jgi:hypothetical protein
MRLAAYLRAQSVVAPFTLAVVVLAMSYGGGVARPEEAYGVSAVILFPILAWQSKILLDAEPDVQRRLARIAVGTRAEIGSGLLAAAVAMVPTIVVAMVLPWAVGGVSMSVDGPPLSLAGALGIGVAVHLLVVPPALAVGAWASRPAGRRPGGAVAVLAFGALLALILGLKSSPAPWLAPPLVAAAKDAQSGHFGAELPVLAGWALAWSAVVAAAYWRLRQTRA